jgi:hypothetical protein
MHIGLDYRVPWAENRGVVTTNQKYTTGTVAITQGTAALVGTSTAWATANAFSINNVRTSGKIIIAGDPTIYKITTVTDDTNIVLANSYVGSTVTEASYTYFEDEYTLDADFLRVVDIDFFDEKRRIRLMDRQKGRQWFPFDATTREPEAAWIFDDDFASSTARVKKIRFWLPPDTFYSIPYWFITDKLVVSAAGAAQVSLSADADEPIVPLRYRHVLVFHALYHWYRDKKNDTRSQEAKAEYVDLMLRISNDFDIGERRARFEPTVGPYKTRAQRPYRRGAGGRFDVGGRFDRVLDRGRW